MKLYAWLTVCLALFITEKLCGKVPDGVPPHASKCTGNTGKIFYQICFPGGGGFHSYVCNEIHRDKYMWQKVRTAICPKDKLSCKCSPYGDDNHPICECYNSLTPPKFPPTGIIRWSGKRKEDLHYYVGGQKPTYSRLEGEAHRMANGQYLFSDRNGFVIYIPDGAYRFIKYTGKHGHDDCSKKEVLFGGDLSSLWQKRPYEGKYYRLKETTPLKGGVSMQKWQRYHDVEDGDWLWIWKVKYDSDKKYAIPVEYRYQSYDWFDSELYQEVLNYTYEPINGNDESFQLKDYCSN